MSNQYVIDVEWDHPDFRDGLNYRKRVLINDAECDEFPQMTIEDFLTQKYGAAVKSYQVVRVIGEGLNRFDEELVNPTEDHKGPQLTAVMEIDMDFVQNLITALNESKLPLGTKALMRNQLDSLQEQLTHSSELWVIAR
jgi:hypothetical protein